MIIDDSLYENEETFYVTLLSHLGSKINHERNTSAVIIAPDSKDGKLDVCNYGTRNLALPLDLLNSKCCHCYLHMVGESSKER